MDSNLKLQVEIQTILSYKRLSYTPWYAIAEFIDNSTQAYFNNKHILDEQYKKEGSRLIISVQYTRTSSSNQIVISDNSIGMSKSELKDALKIGSPPVNDKERSKYGLGMKTAACWFGNFWTVETKKLGEDKAYKIEVDVEKAGNNVNHLLPTEEINKPLNEHYTIITITSLNRQFHGNRLNTIRDILTSMYRFDFDDIGLILNWQGQQLNWEGFEKRFYTTQEGKPYKKSFSFEIGNPKKNVTGWVAVLAKGSRNDAGFSLIQNRRVIQTAYKPKTIYGDESNDLINQRVVGELFVDKFAVSHTKDSILWQDDEEDELEIKLGELCEEAKILARNLRVRDTTLDKTPEYKDQAVKIFISELKSSEIKETLFSDSIPDERAIKLSYKRLIESSQSENPTIEVVVGDGNDAIKVKVYFRSISEFEPYLIIETSVEENTLIVIINAIHPYWLELKNYESILGFIRHCVYDGLAEWRAFKKGTIGPDTVKYIKDKLLRLSFEITNNQFDQIVPDL